MKRLAQYSSWISVFSFGTAVLLAIATIYLAFIGVPANVPLEPSNILHNEGAAFTYGMRSANWPLAIPTDGGAAGYVATAHVKENGRDLGPAHALHQEIRQIGGGRFSYWNHTLYFSASDNSDPRTNGKFYQVSRTAYLSKPIALLGCIPAIALFALALRRRSAAALQVWAAARKAVAWCRNDPRAFWAACGIVAAVSFGIRLFWTFTLQSPFITPDTASYVWAAMEHPFLPFGEQRTPGFPFAISISAALFQHPAGLLLMANLTALASALALAYALAQWIGLRALAFVMFFYLCFSPKNMAFEYYLMSEHYSRASFVLYAAAILMVLKSPYSWRTAAFISAVTVWALLVKPTAIVCIVVTSMVYGFFYLRHAAERPRLRMVATAVTAASVGTLVLYMAAFDIRFGRFALTNFTGTNQFSHSGHLIDLESKANADLKARLRPIIERYQREFVAKHEYEPNWLIYGSTTEALRQSFGSTSPRSILEGYLRDRGVTPDSASMNRLYGELALEGIRAHPMAYAAFAFDRGRYFVTTGYSFLYGQHRPSAKDFADHRRETAELRAILYAKWNVAPPPCSANPPPPPPGFFVARALLHGPLAPCGTYSGVDPGTVERASFVDTVFQRVAARMAPVFAMLPFFAWAFPPALLFPGARSPQAMRAFGVALVSAAVTFGYVALHGLINTAEPPRLFAPIQDIAVLALLAAVFSGLYGIVALINHAARQYFVFAEPRKESL